MTFHATRDNWYL